MRWNARVRRQRREQRRRREARKIGQWQLVENRGGLRAAGDGLLPTLTVFPQPQRTPLRVVVERRELVLWRSRRVLHVGLEARKAGVQQGH